MYVSYTARASAWVDAWVDGRYNLGACTRVQEGGPSNLGRTDGWTDIEILHYEITQPSNYWIVTPEKKGRDGGHTGSSHLATLAAG